MSLFSKLKDYNEILEAILDKKYFSSNVKNLWLSMIYKLEIAYSDYLRIKRDVRTKDEFLEEIIETIQKYTDHVQVVEPESAEAEILKKNNVLALTNDRERSILAYPTELAFLYAISDIIPKYFYIDKNYIFKNLLQNALVEGFNFNNLSILQDFNGWSWDNSAKPNTPFISNLIYQNLICLFGEHFLTDWRNNASVKINYLDDIIYKIENLDRGNKYLLEVIKLLYKNANQEEIAKLEEALSEKRDELAQMNDREEYLKNVRNQKLAYSKRVQKIDKALNNDDLLIQEYEKFNRPLSNDKKIGNFKAFRNMLARERETCVEEIRNLNNLQNPIMYLKRKDSLEEMTEIYTNNERLEIIIVKSQIEFLKLFAKKSMQATTKEEFIDYIYKLRFYKKINISKEKKLEDIPKLQAIICSTMQKIITKACSLEFLKEFSKDENLNFKIINTAIDTNIIDLTEVKITITINKDMKLLVKVYDKDVFEKEEELELINGKDDLIAKQKRMIKLFY
jgi:hypothetical protein